MKRFGKKKELYLSDRQPLTPLGVVLLIVSYLILFG